MNDETNRSATVAEALFRVFGVEAKRQYVTRGGAVASVEGDYRKVPDIAHWAYKYPFYGTVNGKPMYWNDKGESDKFIIGGSPDYDLVGAA